jgi:hypothetical protein
MSNYDETINNQNPELEEEYDIDKDVEEFENVGCYTGEGEVVTYNDIIHKAVGLDEYGNPKSCYSVEIGTYNGKTNEVNVANNTAYYNPSINIVRTGEFVMIDFVFKNRTDTDLRTFWALLNKYGKDFEKALREDNHIIPLFRLQIVPNYYSGRFSMLAVTPMYWVLQPETPTSEINTIRMIFKNDSIGFVESEGYNESDIIAELERADMQEDYVAQAIQRRREEEEEYQNERNERLEEMRRNRTYE